MALEKVLLAKPRGFCAGVVRAVDIVNIALEVYEKPLYVRKEIVHNRHVVEELRGKGTVFVDTLLEVPSGATVVFSAHGVSPEVREKARAKHLKVIDATCPLVTKVHLEALKYAREGYTIVLIGHKGHEEVVGTMGEAPEHMVLISTREEVEQLRPADPARIAYLTQTTLSLDETREIITVLRERFPLIVGPPSEDICYATQNRQESVQAMAKHAGLILVVGSANSSNSNRLVEEAKKSGARSYLIDDYRNIQAGWFEGVQVVGVTAGASAPEVLVQEVVDHLKTLGAAAVEEFETTKENVHFALPANLASDLEAKTRVGA
ncbi:MAG: 4-hydroxy-3-methylbut-2-enyl diphosphate reductase [Acidimicrobiia bacterium]|nr:4-hydroxy-3-methylbut-2-enyl diphosphate reductase [Acidimicrobiia bacterium]